MNNEIQDMYNNQFDWVMAQPNKWWDECHNFIQLLFPTTKPSAHHPNSPLLTIEGAQFLVANTEKVEHAVGRFKAFMVEHDQFYQFNHNFLRITRIIQCLVEIGKPVEAKAFYTWATTQYINNNTDVEDSVLTYWSDALNVSPLIYDVLVVTTEGIYITSCGKIVHVLDKGKPLHINYFRAYWEGGWYNVNPNTKYPDLHEMVWVHHLVSDSQVKVTSLGFWDSRGWTLFYLGSLKSSLFNLKSITGVVGWTELTPPKF